MTSWVFSIVQNHPEHWQIAQENLFWDLTKNFKPAPGDVAYFWQAPNAGFLGYGVVSDYGIVPPSGSPWRDGRSYTHRVYFGELSEIDTGARRWGDLQTAIGVNRSPRSPIAFRASDTEERIRQVLSEWASTTIPSLDVGYPSDDLPPAEYDRDDRHRSAADVVRRQGQGPFRNSLLAAYDGKCAITGTRAEETLQAAHIAPYRGTHSHRLENGLLLRADVHNLFDRHLLTIEAVGGEFMVHVDPALDDPEYRQLDHRSLKVVPSSHAERPSPPLLSQHHAKCEWLQETLPSVAGE